MNNIEELYELINPELITSVKTLLKEMEKAKQNKNAIDNYLLACVNRYAQITNQKVFKHELTYDVTVLDYYVGTDKDKIEIGPDSLHDEIIDYGDGNWLTENLIEVADYTKKEK